MESPVRFKFKLSEAIAFARSHGLRPEASEIQAMAVHRSIPKGWAVRRARFIELFEERGLIDSFAAEYWPARSSSAGQIWRQAQFEKKLLNERLIATAPAPEEPDDDDSDPDEEAAVSVADASLSLERDIERSLLQDLTQLGNGLRLYDANGKSGEQFDTGAVGRLDILAVDDKSDLVVIELKAGRADDRVCGQILRYIGWVRASLANGQRVRGVIVANDFTDSLKFAAKAMPDVVLKKYRVRFEFADI